MPAPLRMRRGACRSAIPSLSTIAEEEEGQRSRKRRGKGGGSDYLLRADEKSSWSRPDSSASGQYTYTIPSPTEIHIVTRPEPLTLKIDERQRLVRERREELEKQNAARGSKWMEREERSRQFHERQLEERRKRLDEQRDKEDRRRAAVEEKRRQNLEEEKARYEAVIRRTMERSQRVRPKSNRWSWGGTLSASTSHNSDTDRRSVSTMNLSKPTDPVISKRLSSSSAALLNSPDRALQKQTSLSSSCLIKKTQSKSQISKEKIPQDKPAGMRRMPLTPWENTMISRLQTPTHSYLARSRSAMSLSGEAASCHPMSSMSFKSIQSRGAERPIKAGLNLERPVRAGYIPPDSSTRRKTTQNLPIDRKDKDNVRKSWSNLSYPTTSLSLFTPRRSPSPVGYRSRVTNPSPNRKRLEEEKAQREREEAERLQRQREEAERLQRQKEEEEARQREKGERLRLEREKHFQKEEAERMERKKRLEEIMKRTRRSDQKTTPQSNGDVSQQSGQNSASSISSSPSVSVSAPQAPETSETVRSDSNGHTGPSFITPILPTSDHSVTAQLRENGAVTEAFEEVIEVPMGTKLSRQDGDGEEVENEEEEKRKVPLLAFGENGSMHNVSGLEENPAQ
ncbi:ensconsin [Sinocyclocheilus grahami]|uniref:ensconsin n=1 Tax=Sinocyclocheilus grahami TaxID=75366 RepID=UPI0007AD4648|nr:PREDICTED: ensconsin-like [Sinocyclocheilus grahami]